MALGSEIVNLVRRDRTNYSRQGAGITQVTIMQFQHGRRNVGIGVKMLQAGRIERAGAPDDPMDLVSFRQEQFRQIRTVLTGNPSDESFFAHSWWLDG